MASAAKISARANRSTAKKRRMSALRTCVPRRTWGALAAGPLAVGSPMTKAPHRRQRHAWPSLARWPNRSRNSGSSGANVT